MRLTMNSGRRSWRSGASGQNRPHGSEAQRRRCPLRDPPHYTAKRRGRPVRAESNKAEPRATAGGNSAAMARWVLAPFFEAVTGGPRISSAFRGASVAAMSERIGHASGLPGAGSVLEAKFYPMLANSGQPRPIPAACSVLGWLRPLFCSSRWPRPPAASWSRVRRRRALPA